MIPAAGVYAVKVRLEQGMEMKWGMMNIGTRPTFGGKRTTIETHIFHFDGDIYGQLLLVSFVHRIRASVSSSRLRNLQSNSVKTRKPLWRCCRKIKRTNRNKFK